MAASISASNMNTTDMSLTQSTTTNRIERLNSLIDKFIPLSVSVLASGNYEELIQSFKQLKKSYDYVFEDISISRLILPQKGMVSVFVTILQSVLQSTKKTPHLISKHLEIFSISLNVLGNLYSRDESVKLPEDQLNLFEVLQQILSQSFLSTQSTILHRALRLTSNILKKEKQRDSILKGPLRKAILDVVIKLKVIVHNSPQDTHSENEKVLSTFLRCIRLCASDTEVTTKMSRLGVIQRISEPLFWSNGFGNDTLRLEIMRALNAVCRMQYIGREIIERMTTPEDRLVKEIIKIYRDSNPKSEIHKVAVQILIKFTNSTLLVESLISHGISGAIFYHISLTDDTKILDYQLLFLHKLLWKVKRSEAQMFSIISAPAVTSSLGATLKILTKMELFHHHATIWWIYKRLPTTIESLVKAGLMEAIKQSIGLYYDLSSYRDLIKKLALELASSATVYSCCNLDRYGTDDPCCCPLILTPDSIQQFEAIQDEMFSQSNPHDCVIDSWTDDGPSVKRIKLDESKTPINASSLYHPVPKIWPCALNTTYLVSVMTEVLNVIKLLFNIEKVRPMTSKLSDIVPALLSLFVDGIMHTRWQRIVCEKSPALLTDLGDLEQIYTSTTIILGQLFRDQSLFPSFLSEQVPCIIRRIEILATAGDCTDYKNVTDIEKLRTQLNDSMLKNIRNLNRPFETTVDLKRRLKFAMYLVAVIPEQSDPYDFFQMKSISLFLDVLTTGCDTLNCFEVENILLSLVYLVEKIVDDLHYIWIYTQLKAGDTIDQKRRSEAVITKYVRLDEKTSGTVSLVLGEDTEELHVDKEFLVAISPVLEAMLDGNFLEAQSGKVKLPQYSKSSFIIFLAFAAPINCQLMLKNCKIVVDTASAECLMESISIAHYFNLRSVYNALVGILLSSRLTLNNFLNVYEKSLDLPFLTTDFDNTEKISIRLAVFLFFLRMHDVKTSSKMFVLKQTLPYLKPMIIEDFRTVFSQRYNISQKIRP